MKKFRNNGIILLLITIIVLYFVMKDNFVSIIHELSKVNILWFILALIVVLLYVFFQAKGLYEIIKVYDKKYKWHQALKLQFMTNFFNGITPFSTGGQPLQVYILKRDGIRATNGTNIIMQNFILYQCALVLYGIVALGINALTGMFSSLPVLRSLIVLGFGINTAVLVGLFVISFTKKLNHWVMEKGIQMLAKMHLVKNSKETEEKWEERLTTFHNGAKALFRNRKTLLKGFLYQVLGLTCLYILPYFVFQALGADPHISALVAIVASAYIWIIGAFVPIPGASGGIEYGFLQFFGVFLGGGILSAGLIIWRFLSYYLLMIIGGIVLSFYKEEKKI